MKGRQLIVNADDFGLSAGINRGIIAAHEHGVVTSASLMVRGDAIVDAASYANTREDFDAGLHIDLGEWRLDGGEWVALYEVVDLDDGVAVEAEIRRQVAAFNQLMGRGPTHIDSHQHLHRRSGLQNIVARIARELDVPLRHLSSIRYCGNFYGQDADGSDLRSHITVDALITLIDALPSGVTELACHPGFAEDLPTMYRTERAVEVATLCDVRVREAIVEANVELTRFSRIVATGAPP